MILKEKLKEYRLILASKSPRRKFLLHELGLDFEVRVIENGDETYPNHLEFTQIPIFLAEKKAQYYRDQLNDNEVLVTSDTIVWCNGKVLGKPVDRNDAISILGQLSANKHVVITGVCLTTKSKTHTFNSLTDVHFRELTLEEIEYYVDTFKPYDKAGAYGIQEWIGYVGVERIDGSFFNVMGLPVQKLYCELMKFL